MKTTDPAKITDSPEEIQVFCLEQLDVWSSHRRSVFSWPMDRIAGKRYGYIIHVSIVEAWNDQNRETSCEECHRYWLSNLSNIRQAVGRWNRWIDGEGEI